MHQENSPNTVISQQGGPGFTEPFCVKFVFSLRVRVGLLQLSKSTR